MKCARADSRTPNQRTDSEERLLPIPPGNGVLEQNCSRAEESAGELPIIRKAKRKNERTRDGAVLQPA
ncbi:MAG: hypothetical protein DBY25_03360 [Clostridiales bacterium]|nr:MAG: hypothetical protein DBY25_03360 [Clostridiales bacterium]